MYSVEEICEEQEREYKQLMEEDDQYCHPESFKWGFEHGFEYALSKFGWHPVSELPPEEGEYIVKKEWGLARADLSHSKFENGKWSTPQVKWWCYPPEEE